jgi:hypothetical protein
MRALALIVAIMAAGIVLAVTGQHRCEPVVIADALRLADCR